MTFKRTFAAYSKSGRIVEISDDKSYLQKTYPDLLVIPYVR